MSPSQNVGMDSATMEPKVSRWSKREYWRTALTMPVKSPRATATVKALSIRTIVAGMRSTTTSRTSRPSRYDRPQLPVRTPPTQRTYCSGTGRSSPSSRVIRSRSSALIVGVIA